jgi:hypothetical protein
MILNVNVMKETKGNKMSNERIIRVSQKLLKEVDGGDYANFIGNMVYIGAKIGKESEIESILGPYFDKNENDFIMIVKTKARI